MRLNKTTYLLICLIEECAEIIQAVCKAIRFGLNDRNPTIKNARTNLDDICVELDDLQGVAAMLKNDCDIKVLHSDRIAIENKIAKIEKFIPYSQKRGTLEK